MSLDLYLQLLTYKYVRTNTERYIFRQQHSSSYIQRRLDYFFKSIVLQESVKNPDVLAAFSTDHSPILFSVFSKPEGTRGKGFWKQLFM